MERVVESDLEVASTTVVFQAARDFAVALAETEEFEAFEQANERFRRDEHAQQAMRAFQSKQQSLSALLMLNAVSEEERTELERLYAAFAAEPAVVAYVQAQDDLTALARTCAALLSRAIGLDYAASCGSGCCG